MLSVPTGNGIVITGWLRCQSCSLWCYLVGLWIRSSSSCLHQTHHSRIQDFPMWKINCSVRFLAARLRHQSTPPWGLMMWCGSVSSELSLNWSTSLNALEHFVLPTVLFPWTCFATVTVLMLFREEYLCNLYLLVSFSWNDNQISATLSQSQSRCSLTTT